VPRHFNMAAYCLAHARTTPDKPALIVITDPASPPTEVWSFAALEDAVLRLGAGLLSRGLEPGDRLMIRLENTSDYALCFFAAVAVGLVPVPVSDQLTGAEAAFLLADSRAAAIALSPELPVADIPEGTRILAADDLTRLRGAPRGAFAPMNADDPAFLIYTSGTTARPKGVLHAHRSAWGRIPMYRGWYGLSARDRMLHAGGFNWTYTLGTGLTDPWACGATAIIYTGEKSPAVWPRLIADHGATIFAAVPSLYRQILKYGDVAPGALGALRHGLSAGETLPDTLAQHWRERSGRPIYEALGQSEISTYISSSPGTPPKPGHVGRPQPGRYVAILPHEGGTEPVPRGEPGLIAVHRSDPGLMLHYWDRPDEDAAMRRDDWFLGGDAGVMAADGYIAHLGRDNDLMNAMGYRVSPAEVEAALCAHPGVGEAAVAQIEARPGVEIIAAFVVRAPGETVGAEALEAFVTERLARYKRPREYVFVDALPRTTNGKLRRAALAAMR
jgi:acetyl-CoA synthetase